MQEQLLPVITCYQPAQIFLGFLSIIIAHRTVQPHMTWQSIPIAAPMVITASWGRVASSSGLGFNGQMEAAQDQQWPGR